MKVSILKNGDHDDGGGGEFDGKWVPDTPDQENGSQQNNDNWAETPEPNSPHMSGPSPNPSYDSNNPQTPATTYNSPINSQSEASSSTGGGAPKRYRLISELLENTYEIELPPEELMFMSNDEEPSRYVEAKQKEEWLQAMNDEIASIERNKTWKLVEIPRNHKPIGLKWVFKVKRDPTSKIVKHKARIVAKGYVQKYGVDYDEVFAPVARTETVRVILGLAGTNGWGVHHLDVKSTFLNGKLEEEVFVTQPEGFEKKKEKRRRCTGYRNTSMG